MTITCVEFLAALSRVLMVLVGNFKMVCFHALTVHPVCRLFWTFENSNLVSVNLHWQSFFNT